MIWTIPPLTPTSFLITWELCVPGALLRPVSHCTLSYQREREPETDREQGQNEVRCLGDEGQKGWKHTFVQSRNIWSKMFAHLNYCGRLTVFRLFTYCGLPHIHIKQLKNTEMQVQHQSVTTESTGYFICINVLSPFSQLGSKTSNPKPHVRVCQDIVLSRWC